MHHVLTRSENKNAMRFRLFNRSAHFLRMPWKNKDGAAYCHDAILFFFRGFARDDLTILDKDSIIDNSICRVFMRYEERTMALTGTAWSHQGDNIH